MFRRLANVLQGQGQEPFQDAKSATHQEYIQAQEKYFNTLPNLILSGTPGLAGFDKAIQSADTLRLDKHQATAVEHPNEIFRQVPSYELSEMAAICSRSSMDELIASKNPTDRIGCGWLYSPPDLNSPYPKVSTGFLGKIDAPIKAFNPPSHKQWFFDLQDAKRQVLLDKCKALKACTDIDSEVFKGFCGFCTHTNQGVPIDQTGQPLYPSDPRGGCDSEAIIRSAGQCPPPPPPPPGPAPMVDRTCDPVGGRLGTECLRRQVIAAGCNERGALALALSGSPDPRHYLMALNRSEALKLYQRVAQPPLNLDIFKQGQATTQQVLQEARQLVGNTQKPETSGLGLAARDLCIRTGTFEKYDICSEISDSQSPPYDISCLQRLFLKMGGTASGRMYPSEKNMTTYNSFGSWGEVKSYLQRMYQNMYVNTPGGVPRGSTEGFQTQVHRRGNEGFQAAFQAASVPQAHRRGNEGFQTQAAFQAASQGGKYDAQRQAMSDLLGIVPEKAIHRVPYRQGVEVFWFVPGDMRWGVSKPPKMAGFLRRTIERDIVQLQPGPSRVPQIGGGPCAAMVQLMDIRAQEEASVTFRVNIDDGFWIAVNQPHSVDRKAVDTVFIDEPGLFEHNWYQGPTWHSSKACTPFSPSTPNITKMFFQDSGCGWHSFLVEPTPCSGANPFQKSLYSLTLEDRAPFLAFEVNRESGKLEELRLPAMFEQWLDDTRIDGQAFIRTDDRQLVPGKKAFLRITNNRSLIDFYNIAYQSWKTLTFAVRFQSLPVKDTLLKLAVGRGWVSIILTQNGSNIAVSVEHTLGGGGVKTMPFRSGFPVGKWYLFFLHNRGTGFDLYCNAIDETVASKGKAGGIGTIKINHNGPMYVANETWHPKSGSGQPAGECTLMWGGRHSAWWPGIYSSSVFQYDIAWIHFFDQFTTNEDIYRDCMGNWQYTQFPVAYQKFETLKGED